MIFGKRAFRSRQRCRQRWQRPGTIVGGFTIERQHCNLSEPNWLHKPEQQCWTFVRLEYRSVSPVCQASSSGTARESLPSGIARAYALIWVPYKLMISAQFSSLSFPLLTSISDRPIHCVQVPNGRWEKAYFTVWHIVPFRCPVDRFVCCALTLFMIGQAPNGVCVCVV